MNNVQENEGRTAMPSQFPFYYVFSVNVVSTVTNGQQEYNWTGNFTCVYCSGIGSIPPLPNNHPHTHTYQPVTSEDIYLFHRGTIDKLANRRQKEADCVFACGCMHVWMLVYSVNACIQCECVCVHWGWTSPGQATLSTLQWRGVRAPTDSQDQPALALTDPAPAFSLIYESVCQQCKHLIQREIFRPLWVNSLALIFFGHKQSLLSITSVKLLYRAHAWLNIHYVKLGTFFVYKSILDLAGRLPAATWDGFLV